MKVLIAADMEGITGIADRSYVLYDGLNYELGRSLIESDVNAAIEGAIAAGATEILVVDGHSGGKNIRITKLNPRAVLHSGSTRPFSMIAGYDKVDVAMFIGYHAKLGTENAVLDHTYTSRLKLWINGIEAGESYMNALLCGNKNVPVALYSGDQALAEEVRGFPPIAAGSGERGLWQIVGVLAPSRAKPHFDPRKRQKGARGVESGRYQTRNHY